VLTGKPKRGVANQCPWQESGLTEDLKTVAYPKDQPTLARKLNDSLHDRREAGHRPSPQIVSIGKPSRQNQAIPLPHQPVFVPEIVYFLPEHIFKAVMNILLIAGARKDYNPPTHIFTPI
jgi:hypothetical protein